MKYEDNNIYVYDVYHERSKMNDITQYEMGHSVAKFFRNPYLSQAVRESYKVYPYCERIALTRPELKMEFSDLMLTRRSLRDFVPYALSCDELSGICYYSYGITGTLHFCINGENQDQDVRSVPSAGGIYPLDLYLVLLEGSGYENGIYHYNVIEHCLELVRKGDFHEEIKILLPNQYSLDTASAIVLISAHVTKTTIKYGERGYRFVLLDAGHLMQNVYLSTTALGLGCYACGGFLDDSMSDFLGLDGLTETVLYCAVMGKPSANK
jgi:SagB-type dehydrogenase family enzyme